MTEINIGPFLLTQRTQYSKLHIFLRDTGEDITEENEELVNTITYDYNRQKKDPNKYFEISDDELIEFKGITDDPEPIHYLFIPNGIKHIYGLAFADCTFSQIHIPDTVETIGEFAFSNCKLLKCVYMPDSIKNFGMSAFQGCTNISNIRLSNSLTEIAFNAFSGCEWLKTIYIPDNITNISACAFDKCIRLEDVRLSNNLELLGSGTFKNCSLLKKIDLPTSLSSIGADCFMGCSSLKEIILPDEITWLPNGLFVDCESLEYVKLPKNIKEIRSRLFEKCKKLKHVYLPDTISTINEGAFTRTKSLENINIPRSLSNVDAHIFADSSLESITFNHNLDFLDIEETMIYDTVTEKLKHENYGLIYGSKIEKIIIDNSVDVITKDAFGGCGGQIKKIDYLGSKSEFEKFKENNKDLFENCLTKIREVNFIKKERDLEISR